MLTYEFQRQGMRRNNYKSKEIVIEA